jgi:uncharacterized membrane protein
MVAAIVVVSGMALSQTAPSVSPQYTVKDLGTLGGPVSEALGINNSGQVVGVAETSSRERTWDVYSVSHRHLL